VKTHLNIVVVVLFLLVYPPALTAYDGEPRSWTGTVRGEVMKIDGEVFLIEDSLGRQVQLQVGPNCSRDENIQIGDDIVARVVHKGKETYIKSLKRLSSSSQTNMSLLQRGISPVMEGEILKIDGESYLIKEPDGKEVRLQVDAKTWKEGNITVGDGILATIDDFQTVHAESLAKH